MTPSIDERLSSVIRALSDVVLPSLPPEAGLAQEQVQLSIGHLQILRAQYDAAPDYEADELADAMKLADALHACAGGVKTASALAALDTALTAGRHAVGQAAVRAARIAINAGVDGLVGAVADDGDAACRTRISDTILEHEKARVLKDRQWFAPFGFDSVPTAA